MWCSGIGLRLFARLPLPCLFLLLMKGSARGQEILWQVGLESGPSGHAFGSIDDADFLPDGRILVRDRMTKELSLFSADGGFLRLLGREGEGPGEFRSLGRATVTDSAIALSDNRLGRFVIFDLSGAHLRTERFPEPTLQLPMASRWALPSGGTIVLQLDPLLPGHSPGAVETHVSFFGQGARKIDTLFSLVVGGVGGWVGDRLVLAQAAEPQGAFDLAGDTLLAVADGASASLSWWRIAPEFVALASSDSIPTNPAPISTAQCKKYQSKIPEGLPTPEEMSCPPLYSAVDQIVADRPGRALLRMREANETDWNWQLIEDSVFRQMSFPERFTPTGLRGCLVIGVWKGDYDVPSLQAWILPWCDGVSSPMGPGIGGSGQWSDWH